LDSEVATTDLKNALPFLARSQERRVSCRTRCISTHSTRPIRASAERTRFRRARSRSTSKFTKINSFHHLHLFVFPMLRPSVANSRIAFHPTPILFCSRPSISFQLTPTTFQTCIHSLCPFYFCLSIERNICMKIVLYLSNQASCSVLFHPPRALSSLARLSKQPHPTRSLPERPHVKASNENKTTRLRQYVQPSSSPDFLAVLTES
jgi:hypothetical protein